MNKRRIISYCLYIILFIFCTPAWGRTYHGVALAPDGQNGWVVASDTWGYILHTPNCGINWIVQSTPDERYLSDVFFLTNQKGWICSDQGFVFYTANGGINWIRQVAGLAKRTSRVFFLDDSCGWVSCKGAILGRTSDGGQNWQQICLPNPPFPCDSTWFNGISFLNILKGWICAGRYLEYTESLPGQGDTWFTKGQGYIAVSNDSGLTWQLQKRDTINDFFDIKLLDTLNGFVIGGNDRTMSAVMMRTQSGGNTWQTVLIPAQAKILRAMDVINNNYIWAVGHNGTIIHSRNGGQTWIQQQSNVNTTLYDVDFADTLHGLVAGDSYVLYTHNGGNTWHIANLGIEEERSTHNTIRPMVEIYPNPAKAFFIIRTTHNAQRFTLKMFDVAGKLLKEVRVKTQEARILLKGISPGIYFIQIDNEPALKKIVITKQ